ncbi:PorP/SprF family type IX secretion system membrane protein [Winogradskyella endarachnes]|uniref:Type IX secretion system membrane protein PorP/SprF n=1 Tax=Winogradskyella endarachnes TaxID=2681965 RepID=A0A6L6U826_9FLAO|nr:PorP/SprF family type IX secretion system membrane protein [Winogradskyella endarachnes]MUU77037.1 type IX secretion system membrane protein PorP/SprF [Winogradskyella endarachnes]
MKRLLLLILCICSVQTYHSQEDGDGVVSLNLPARNSLTFNKFNINPTFSFVREQTKYITFNNKREWVQFENAPLTYFGSYSGRFAENIGAGIGVFQQNYGVLTTFGGLLNFAYNARIGRSNNLTFGLNIGAYKSGLNTGAVVTNFDDPSLQNIPDNTVLTINPGINFGTDYLDFGISINNLVMYNFTSSTLIEENQEQSIDAHVMYTGYMDSRGFFDESKFTGLLKTDIYEDKTIVSAVAMITVPKGFWFQGGYNSFYGPTAGIGLNITNNIALEYNYENAIGENANFGSSHDFSIAYRFQNNKYYDYSPQDEVTSILSKNNKRRRRVVKSNSKKTKTSSKAQTKLTENKKAEEAINIAKAKAEAEALAKENEALALLEQKKKEEQIKQAQLEKIEADKKAQEIADKRAEIAELQKAKEEAEAQAKLLAEQKAKEEAEVQAKLLAKQKAKEEAEAQAKLLAEQKAKEEAEAQAKLLAEQKAKEEAEAQAKLLAEQKAKEEAEAQAKLLAEQKAKEEAEAQAKLLAEQKAKEEAEAQAKLLAEQKAKEEAEAQAKLLAEQEEAKEAVETESKIDLIENPTDELAISMKAIRTSTDNSKDYQNELLDRFNEIVEIKDKDLKSLKEENDLSEQGIVVAPRPFKSITAENNELNAIKKDLDKVIISRANKIEELTALYNERSEISEYVLDEVTIFYKKEIDKLNNEQQKTKALRSQLNEKLETIRIATEFEKRRRIKRAAYNSDEDQYNQDRATLKNIKQTTKLNESVFKPEDFDYGEQLGSNISILKNIKNVESGYYLIIAVHSDKKRRDEFLTKVVSAGRTDIDFFHDVSTSKYYIYYEKHTNISDANKALKTKGNRPYNGKMSIVKIEN